MPNLLKVAILFGGKSAEHEISLISGQNIVRALDRSKFEPVLIGIDREGSWFLQEEEKFLALDANPKTISLEDFSSQLAVIPGSGEPRIIRMRDAAIVDVDVVFPILHGPYGEDGTIQGMLKTMGLPFVGPGVLGSSVAMDKDVCKRLMRDAGIPNAKFMVFRAEERDEIDFSSVEKALGLPVFIKPANMGSSVGISRAGDADSFEDAIDKAFQFDSKIVVEEAVPGREIEVAVLGNEHPRGTIPGEIVPVDEFYTYEAKYVSEKGAILKLPAEGLNEELIERMKELAVKTFQVLCCEGLSRVDFFLKEDGTLMVNEVNTLPGFTKISMYPKLWGLEGMEYGDLITRLLELAMERFLREQEIETRM